MGAWRIFRNPRIVAVGVIVVALMAGVAWWWGGRGAPVGEATAGERFLAVDCQARYFENAPALALMFTAPVATRQNFKERLTVVDLGVADKPARREGENAESEATDGSGKKREAKTAANAPKPVGAGNAGGTPVTTSWVVGDNPRILYLPLATPKHRYRITLNGELASAADEKLGQTLSCEVTTEAMPPAFYFASKGTVLPARQNGGLPIITVNVPEVDVQFLRVEPAQLPGFLARIAGARSKRTAESDGDEGEGYDDYSRRKPQGLLQSYELDQLRKTAKSVYLGRFLTDARSNRRNVTHLPVEEIAELREPGIYIAVMNQPGRFTSEFQTTYFYVSDIGIHARRFANSLEVFATSLKTGQAIAATEFQLLDDNGKPLGKTVADSEGRARFAEKTSLARVIIARRGAEYSLLSLVEPALDLSEFDTSGHLARPVKIFAYAGRDLYRPGERFNVSALVRDADGKPLPPMPVAAKLKRADGKVVQQFTLAPNREKPGYFQQAIQLPQDAQTGTWTLEFRGDPAAKPADHVMKLNVEEFLPERMKLDLKSAQAFLTAGTAWEVAMKGDYLYGAPAAGNRVVTTVSTERNRIPFPKEWPGFEYGDFDDDSLKRREDLGDKTLEDDGSQTLAIPVPKANASGAASPLVMRATVSLLESGGRPVVRSIERTLWPAERMIAVRPLWSGKFVREGTPAEFEVIRTDREGKFAPLPAAAKTTLRLYREDREYYWVFDDERGWHSGYHEGNELVESREIELTKRVKVNVPVKWGRYRIEIADRETGLALRYRFYAGWGAQEAEQVGSRPDRVQLKLDKSTYKPGDSARLTITPPHDGEALILVEGNESLYQSRTTVSASGTTVTIPVGRDWNRHDLYISAVVFRAGVKRDKVTPARALGLIHLPIDREDRKLAVKLEHPAKIEPESVLKVKVKATGAASEAGVVTISAVDVGILNITRFATPDAFDFFLGKQRYQPDVLDMYGKFIETMDGHRGRLKFGGDANMRESKKSPQKVKLVDLFSGPVVLNAAGEAEVSINVPDFNGTLKLMATVATPTRFGKADAEVVSAASIVAELATPRFVSPGDRAAMALDVTNMTSETQTFKLNVTSRGPVRVSGVAESVSLKPTQKKTLRMTAEATDAAGEGIITVEVKSQNSKLQLKRESVLAIVPLAAQERTRRFQRVAAGESLKLDAGAVDGYFAGSALTSVTLSTSPPINVNELVKGLFAYPYGCLEQTTSRAFPHVLLDEAAAQSFGLKVLPRAERERAIADAISRLSGMQRASGAFTLWGDGPDEPWLTAYVTDFLKTARDAGYAVPEAMVKRADEWMLKQLNQAATSFPARPTAPKKDGKPDDAITRDAGWWGEYRNREASREGHRRLGALAYMGLVLAREEKAPLSALRLLHDEHRDRALSPLPLVHLGLAMKRMGDVKRAEAAFDAAFAVPYGMTGYEWEWLGDYGTKLRDNAMAYALLEQHKIAHKRKDSLLAELIEQLPRTRYASTQEQLSLLLAARTLSGSKTEEWRASITTDKAAKAETLEGRTTQMREFDVPALKRGVTLTNTGKDMLYISIESSGYPVKPQPPKDDIVQLKRTVYEPDGTPVGARALKVGEQLLVHLEVIANRRIEDGLVVDRVPAGLEIENLNLSQSARIAEFKTPKQGSENRPGVGTGRRTPKDIAEALSDNRVKHREFRDDRFVAAARLEGALDLYYLVRVVTPGQYVVPPSFAEDMYRPEVRALTAGGGSLTVVDRK